MDLSDGLAKDFGGGEVTVCVKGNTDTVTLVADTGAGDNPVDGGVFTEDKTTTLKIGACKLKANISAAATVLITPWFPG